MEAKTGSLQVPGASLYYEACGSGPILLLIAGGAGDAASYAHLANYLVDHYTVVSYDRRGYARSPLRDPDQPVEIKTHSDDVHHLLEALSGAPAAVLGCSIGALIGLDLAIRYPHQVHTLVAHEPPIPAFLSGAWRLQADQMHKNLLETVQREGAAVAIEQFAKGLGVQRASSQLQAGLSGTKSGPIHSRVELPVQAESDRIAEHNRAAFFRYDTRAVARYHLDLSALMAASARILPAGGRLSRRTWPYQCSVALAGFLEYGLVEFPGNHAGFTSHPKQFARRLHEVLIR
jgi:pimeloyl-ACP methyl ester carboxylesterase